MKAKLIMVMFALIVGGCSITQNTASAESACSTEVLRYDRDWRERREEYKDFRTHEHNGLDDQIGMAITHVLNKSRLFKVCMEQQRR